ncbi:MAG TPA: trypsin-like peptidase domain-containing protein [Patescibacteria group bacterium]|nr:trypsin-like peptidase domain-containing protein [Patescibacteria group bacterium]
MNKKILFWFPGLFIVVALLGLGFIWGSSQLSPVTSQELNLDEQTATIRAIQKNRPAVVNITVYETRDSDTISIDTREGTQPDIKIEKGAGTGFLISPNGYILTNKHVVETQHPEQTQYRIILSSGQKYYAQLIDIDPLNDLAVLKIYDKDLPYVELGNSDQAVVGSTVIAIGNALGKYQNTVTKGIISGLGRDFTAANKMGQSQVLNNTIQTDAEINLGNSGGPLINLEGKVIGVNVAVDRTGNSIGFAIPVDEVKPVIRSIKKHGQIIRPRLGVRYQMITPQLAAEEELPRESGALIVEGKEDTPGVISGSPADKAGLLPGDIVFEINAIKITEDSDLRSVVQRYRPGDKIGLKVQRGEQVFIRVVTLGEFE